MKRRYLTPEAAGVHLTELRQRKGEPKRRRKRLVVYRCHDCSKAENVPVYHVGHRRIKQL